MSFIKQQSASSMIGVVVLFLVGSLLVRFIWAGGIEEYFSPNKKLENAIVAAMEQQPGGKVMLEQLEADFPLAYDDMIETMTDQAARDSSPERVVQAGNAWLARFFASHTSDFKFAPIASLDTVLSAEAKALSTLNQLDPLLCDNYVMGWAMPEDLPTGVSLAIGDRTAAMFAAIRAGRADQQLRLDLTDSDVEAIEQVLRDKGLSDAQLSFIMAGERSLSDEAGLKCEAMSALIAGVQEQPEDRRALLIGAIVVGSE